MSILFLLALTVGLLLLLSLAFPETNYQAASFLGGLLKKGARALAGIIPGGSTIFDIVETGIGVVGGLGGKGKGSAASPPLAPFEVPGFPALPGENPISYMQRLNQAQSTGLALPANGSVLPPTTSPTGGIPWVPLAIGAGALFFFLKK